MELIQSKVCVYLVVPAPVFFLFFYLFAATLILKLPSRVQMAGLFRNIDFKPLSCHYKEPTHTHTRPCAVCVCEDKALTKSRLWLRPL